MRNFLSIGGMLTIEVTGADNTSLLMKIYQRNIPLIKVVFINELTFRAVIARKDYNSFLRLAEQNGSQTKIACKIGLYWAIKELLKRPILVGCIVFLILLSILLPRYVLFFKVEGNSRVSTKQILEEVEKCGISFGISRNVLRSEQMKNALLERIPQLQWAGINTYGCVAVISVQEKTSAEDGKIEQSVSSIIASRDGVVREYTVQQGNALCRVGQAVKKGQVLISGYTDCGLLIKATNANGEIYADTVHELKAISPYPTYKRGEMHSAKKQYSFFLGKNIINLYKDSGIWDTSCVKIYKQKNITLPGGFRLPIGIVCEIQISYDPDDCVVTERENMLWLKSAARNYLIGQMIAGKIVEDSELLQFNEGTYVLSGKYVCIEMIGQVQREEIITKDAENDGTNRERGTG